jgi:hypothetical protein
MSANNPAPATNRPNLFREIELYVPAPALLRALAERVERAMSWELSRSGGQLYVTIGGETFEGEIAQRALG